MAEHLSNEIINLYQHKELSVELRFNADFHLASCQPCREKLCENDQLQSLHRAVRANLFYVTEDVSQHLSDEQSVAYVKNQIDAVELEIITSHLVWCKDCKAEINQMRAIVAQFDSREGKLVIAWAGLKKLIRTVTEKTSPSFQRPIMRLATVSLLALFVSCALWWRGYFGDQEKDDSSVNLSQQPTPATESDIAKRDPSVSGATISPSKVSDAFNSSDSSSWLLRKDQRLFEKACNLGELEVSRVIEHLKDTNMGANEKDSFRLLGPGSVVIRETQPTIQWKALEGASKYRVIVSDVSNGRVEVADLFVTDTHWQLDRPLERGHRYTWQIIADKSGKGIYGIWPNREYADFFVIAKDELVWVRNAEKQYKGNSDPLARIALAARYAKAGLVEDAKRQLKNFPKEHPQSPLAARLLENLARQTRQK